MASSSKSMATRIRLLLLCLCVIPALTDVPSSACNSLDTHSPECLPNSDSFLASWVNHEELPNLEASKKHLLVCATKKPLSMAILLICLSIYCVTCILPLVIWGIVGDSCLKHSSDQDERLVEQFITQHRELSKYNAEQLTMGNFMYSDKYFPIKPEYSTKLSTDFGAITKTVNFSDEESSMETINSDVSEATQGMIPRLLTEIDPDTVLFLINTVYFKGMWEVPFDEANTDLKGTFRKSPGGEEMQIPMMHHYKKDLPFLEQSDGTKCLLLPYNVPHMHLALLLPPEGIPIGSFVRNLTGAFLEPLLAERFSRWSRRVNVTLPRFKIASTHSELVETLQSLGVRDIFVPYEANLSKLTDMWEQLYVDQVLQKATIEVNEEGTKATAATAVRGVIRGGFKVFDFIADRPFVYALLRAPSSPAHTQILFMGVVEDPSSE